MVRNNVKTTSALNNSDGTIKPEPNDSDVRSKELETILESYFSGNGPDRTISSLDNKKAVHRISAYNDGSYFAVSMYSRAIDMSSIIEIEKLHGYKLHKFNMQTSALFFWRLNK